MHHMILRTNAFAVEIDPEATKRYSQGIQICDCCWDRNFYSQADRFPKLTGFLAQFGVSILCPDEIAPVTVNGDIHYLFIGYTAVGRILDAQQYTLDISDGGLDLHIRISNEYIPNEHKTKNFFTIQIYNMVLPWVLEEPNPETATETTKSNSLWQRIKGFLRL
jgi:hypothetical protein